MHKYTLWRPLNLAGYISLALLTASDSLSPARPGLAKLSVTGLWLAPLCPAINPNPLALGTVGQGSLPNPPQLLLSALQLEHAKLNPSLKHPPPLSTQLTTTCLIYPITHHSLQIKYTDNILPSVSSWYLFFTQCPHPYTHHAKKRDKC